MVPDHGFNELKPKSGERVGTCFCVQKKEIERKDSFLRERRAAGNMGVRSGSVRQYGCAMALPCFHLRLGSSN
jgi:hypothetical protein